MERERLTLAEALPPPDPETVRRLLALLGPAALARSTSESDGYSDGYRKQKAGPSGPAFPAWS